MEINFEDMVRALCKPGNEIVNELDSKKAHVLHMAIGIMGESVELLEGLIKDDKENISEELGDIEFYFEGMCQGVGHIPFIKIKNNTQDYFNLIDKLLIEAGNILDNAKKFVIYGDETKVNSILENLSNYSVALDQMYIATNHTRKEAIEYNIKKLSKRYKLLKYSNQAAKERADKQGK